MSDRKPKSLWDELVEAFMGTSDDDDDEQARDPSLLVHLMYTAPIVIAVFALMRRHVS